MTLSDRFNHLIANNLYWTQLACEVYAPILSGLAGVAARIGCQFL